MKTKPKQEERNKMSVWAIKGILFSVYYYTMVIHSNLQGNLSLDSEEYWQNLVECYKLFCSLSVVISISWENLALQLFTLMSYIKWFHILNSLLLRVPASQVSHRDTEDSSDSFIWKYFDFIGCLGTILFLYTLSSFFWYSCEHFTLMFALHVKVWGISYCCPGRMTE